MQLFLLNPNGYKVVPVVQLVRFYEQLQSNSIRHNIIEQYSHSHYSSRAQKNKKHCSLPYVAYYKSLTRINNYSIQSYSWHGLYNRTGPWYHQSSKADWLLEELQQDLCILINFLQQVPHSPSRNRPIWFSRRWPCGWSQHPMRRCNLRTRTNRINDMLQGVLNDIAAVKQQTTLKIRLF